MVPRASPSKEMVPDTSMSGLTRKVPDNLSFSIKPPSLNWEWNDPVTGATVPVRVTSAETGYVAPVEPVKTPDTSNEADLTELLPVGSDASLTVSSPPPESMAVPVTGSKMTKTANAVNVVCGGPPG